MPILFVYFCFPETREPAAPDASEPRVKTDSASHMAPEQVRGEAADPRTDIFAFGTLLYEMLLGLRAFRRDTPAETMTQFECRPAGVVGYRSHGRPVFKNPVKCWPPNSLKS